MTHLILIDSRVPGINDIVSSLTLDTESLVFDQFADTFESIKARIQKPYKSIAIAQHNYGLPTFNMVIMSKPALLKDVGTNDPELDSWSEFAEFLQWLKHNGANWVDFLACDLWANADWVYAIETLRSKLGLSIRASIDITGADGNFILESDNVNTIGIYFTDEILNYKYNFYTSSSANDVHANFGYSPLIFTASNPGYVSATAYNSILGGITTGATHIRLINDISNVAMVAMTISAAAVLQINGNVTAFGEIKYGGDTSPVASQLYNITKIIANQHFFTALRADGKVFCWGGGNIINGQNINTWTDRSFVTVMSDISNILVNVSDIFTNSAGAFALTASGQLIAMGQLSFANTNNTTYPHFASGIAKVYAGGYSNFAAVTTGGAAYFVQDGNYRIDSITGSVNSNPIVKVYICGINPICIRTTLLNTTQITTITGSTLYYTIPAGVFIARAEIAYSSILLVLLSTNILLIISGLSCTVVNNVTDLATNTLSYAYLKNNVVYLVGPSVWGSLTNNTYGIPAGANLTNVRRLVSTSMSFGALKYDNTFVWWGYINNPGAGGNYSSVAFATATATQSLYNAISSNIVSVYSTGLGYVFTKTDGTIVPFCATTWGAGTVATATSVAKRANKNVYFVPNDSGFIAVETNMLDPSYSSVLSQYNQYAPTTVTYYNNTPDAMARYGKKYSLVVDDGSVLGTYICTADSFTYTFTNVVYLQRGSVTSYIRETSDYTTSYVEIGKFKTTILENTSVSRPDQPEITAMVLGTVLGKPQLTVSFKAPAWNGGTAIIGYKYTINQGQSYNTLPANTTQIVLSDLSLSSYTIFLYCTNYVGDSYYDTSSVLIYNPPSAPTVSSVTLGNTQVTLNVNVPTANNGGGAITGYKYAFSASGSYNSFAVNPSGGTTAVTSYTIPSLLNGTPYTLYVKATNGAGDSPATTTTFTLTVTVPQIPVITSVESLNSSIRVNFTPPYDGGAAITDYKYILNNSVADSSAVSIVLVGGTFIIPNLTNGTTYKVKMQAVNSVGTSDLPTVYSSNVIPKTVPSSPTITSVTVGNQQAVVEFTEPDVSGGSVITKYRYRLGVGNVYGAPVDISGLTSPFTIPSLQNGTSYKLKMTAVNAAGESALSAESATFIPATVPTKPVIQSITASNRSISVNFTADNGGNALTSLEYFVNDMSSVSIETTSSPLVIGELTNGTPYQVKLRVSNSNGSSDISEYSTFATPKTVPGAPSIDSIQAGNRYVQFAFSPPGDDGSSAITGYKYSINDGSYTAIGLVQSPYRINQNISNGTSYTVKLIATNAIGDSAPSAESSSVIPCTIPVAPNLVSLQNGDKQATIQLSAGNNGGSEISSYTYSVGDGEPVVIYSLSSPLVFSDLTIGTTYSFQIKATNSIGDSAATTIQFTGKSIPNTPFIVGAVAGNNSITLEFNAPNANSSDITGYKYSIESGVYLPATLVDASHILITRLHATTEYNVVIAAVNAIGQSADSNFESATPYTYPLAPTIGTITVGNGNASIEFTANSDNGSAITKYEYSLNDGEYNTYDSVESPLVLNNLGNGVPYTIKMKAKNEAGSSTVASSKSFMPRTVPMAPIIMSVTAGNQSCEVGFVPGFFNGSSINKYRYSFDGTNYQDATGTVSPITINGLTNGETYSIYLIAVNSVGSSGYFEKSSDFIPFVTQPTPNPPINLSVIPGNNSVAVYFTDGVNTGSAINRYNYSIDGGDTSKIAEQIESPLIIYGLTNGQEKTIKISAANNSGSSDWSEASDPFTPCTIPDAPIITGLQSGNESIVVSYIPGSSNGAAISSYEYSIDASNTFMTLSNDSIIYNLSNGVTYNVKIRAVNSVGPSAPSASFAVAPHKKPDAPTITSVLAGDQSITVAFTPGATNGSVISRYEYAYVIGGEVKTFAIAQAISSPFDINGLDNGTGYILVLRAVSTLGEYSAASAESNEVFPGTVPNQPIIIKIKPENCSIHVNWVTDSNGSNISSVLYNLNGGPFVDAGTTDASFSIPGLLNGSEYSVQIIAVNSHGSSIPSVVSEPVKPFYNPDPPIITSVVPGDSKALIYLTPGNTNGSNVLGYKYSLNGASYKWVNETTSPISIYNLNNGSNYNISLKTIGETVGDSSIVELPSSVMPYTSPDPPIIKSVIIGDGSAVVIFADGSSNGLTLTGYRYSLDASNYMDISAVDYYYIGSSLVDHKIKVTGLTNGVTYSVSLKSVSTVATSASSVPSSPFMPYANPSPPTISKIVTGNQTASVYLTDGAVNGSGAKQAYSYTFDGSTFYWATSSTSPIVISSNLVNSIGYQIQVATKTELGMSEYCAKSDRFVPYTLPGAPTITNVVAGNGVAYLYFTDGSSNGRPITKYQYQYTINGVTSSFEVTGTSPLSLSGLTNGTNYTVTLKNYNLAGYSPASIASSGFMPYTVPSAPTITNLIPASNQITVYVSPGNTNGSEITRYSYSLNGGSYVNTANAALSFDISGLTNGTSYTVALKAENAAGVGAASTTSAAVIPFTVPNAPTITGVTVGNTTATVAITNGNNNGRTATQYQYTYTNTSTGVATILTTSTSVTQLSSILITGLTNWASYTVKVKAINLAGASVDSSASNPFMPYNIPGAPVIASVVPGNASILVNMDGLTIGTGVVGYRYSFNSTNYTYISGGGSSFSIPNLVNATTYRVYVKSVTSQGDSPASLQSNPVVPYTVPNAPTISSVVAGNRTVSIYVVDGSNNGRSVINYEHSTDGVKYNIVDPASPIVLDNLVNWQSYSFYVRAVNLAGSSGPSAMSSTVVPFLVPTSASITSITPGDSQLTVKMDGWTSDAGIIGYKYALDNSDNLVFVSSTTDSFVIPELTNGQDYVVRVKSCTTAGDSPLSSASSPIHPSAPPSPPSNVVVTPLNESAIVTFTDGASNGETIQYYLYSLVGDADVAPIDTPIMKRDDGTIKIFGIKNAINYTLRLRAMNNTGLSNYAANSNTFMPFGIPLVAPVVTQVLPGNACAYVYFSAADTNGSALTKFRWSDGKNTYDVSGITSPLTITGLTNKKPSTVAIASCNAVGISPFTSTFAVLPGVPLAPVITSVEVGPSMLLVHFNVPQDNGFAIASYSYGFVGTPAFSKGTSASTTSVSPLMVPKLKNGTPYNVVLIASNANGNSAVSNSVGNRTPCAPPTKVVITGVTSLFDGALISFLAPPDNGTPLLKYKYALGTSTNYTDISGLTLPLRIYGISPNTVNTVKIIATNAAGDSSESAPSKTFTFVYLPPAAPKITGLTISLNRMTVAFLPPTINGSAITGYKYALDVPGTQGTFLNASGTILPLVITEGVLPNVTYNVRIIAVNGAGDSPASAPAAKPVSFVYLPPIAPVISTVVVGDRSALVTFTGAPARGAPITGYAYTLDSSATTIYDVSGAVSPLLITELTNDVSYNIRIAAITPAGYSAWSVAKPATPVYKAPDKPVITTVVAGNGQLTVTFTVPAANGSPIIGYKYTTNGGADKTEVATIIGGKSFIIEGLTNGTVYNVQMCATNILGESDLSLVKAGTPKA